MSKLDPYQSYGKQNSVATVNPYWKTADTAVSTLNAKQLSETSKLAGFTATLATTLETNPNTAYARAETALGTLNVKYAAD